MPGCRQNAQRDRQIKPTTFLGQISWCQIDGNASGGKFEPLISYDGQMLVADRRTRGAGYVGLGYSSRGGGPWGFEVLLMYNFNQPSNTIESPLDYRAGVTYNF